MNMINLVINLEAWWSEKPIAEDFYRIIDDHSIINSLRKGNEVKEKGSNTLCRLREIEEGIV